MDFNGKRVLLQVVIPLKMNDFTTVLYSVLFVMSFACFYNTGSPVILLTRNAWQSLACSQRGIAVAPPSEKVKQK